ncbi:MAG: biotin/lipoyl-binding protein, partial [Ilumatobacter sp.]
MGEFRMPSLGADMEFGTVVEWLVAEGDEVSKGDIVAVVDTDKADIDVEIFESGVIDELLVPEGERVEVGTPLARLRSTADGERAPTTSSTAP